MQTTDAGLERLSDEDRQLLEAWLMEFDLTWIQGQLSARVAALPAAGHVLRMPALVEMIKIDLERNWESGRRVGVEIYLREFPELGSARPLIRTEIMVRRRFRAPIDLSDFSGRFPELSDQLSDLFAEADKAGLGQRREGLPVIAGYEILELIARGGMGIVYKARHVALGRIVALKMILGGDRAELLVRLRQEAQALAKLHHPNIVDIHEIGEHDGCLFVCLEYVEGASLDVSLQGTPLPPQSAAKLVETLAHAVDCAHQHNIIHRDLKPANILLQSKAPMPAIQPESTGAGATSALTQGVEQFDPKITDFGLSKRLDETCGHTHTGQILGTPSYMAPEQALGKNNQVGIAADIYGLGAILYETLTGRPPFRAPSILETLEQVRTHEPVAPRFFQSKIPHDLETICLKCLQKEPSRRYLSASDLAADLQRFRNHEPVKARPVGRFERTRRWCRRNPAVAGLLAAVAGVLLLGTAVSMVLAIRANYQARKAEAAEQQALRDKSVALQERANARAVNEFLLEDLIGQADPERRLVADHNVEQNPDMKVLELLDRAAVRVEEKFKDQPITEAAVQWTIGYSYRGLGRYDQAQRHLERALALRQQQLGDDHPDTVRTKYDLAILHHNQAHYEVAESLYVAVLAKWRMELGGDASDTLSCTDNLAALYVEMGRLDSAEPLYAQALEMRQNRLPPDHADILASKNNLAGLSFQRAQFERAEQLYLEVLNKREKTLGPTHSDVLYTKIYLADLYSELGRHERAQSLYEDVLQARTNQLGPDHPLTLAAKNSLAELYTNMGLYDLGERYLKEVLEVRSKKLGPGHRHTLATKSALANLYQERKQFDLAEPLYREVLDARKSQFGADHRESLAAMADLAALYQDQDKPELYDLAEKLYREVLTVREQKLGGDHPDTLAARFSLARLYHDEDDFDQAERLYTEVLARQEKKLDSDHPSVLATKHNLAELFRQQEKDDRAEKLYLEVLQARRLRLGEQHHDTLETRWGLAQLYEQMHAWERVAPLLLENLAVLQGKARKGSTAEKEMAAALSQLGRARLHLKKHADAETALRDALEIQQRSQPDDWTTYHTMALLGAALAGQYKFEPAEPLLLQGHQGMADRLNRILDRDKDRVIETISLIVALYDSWGKKDKADEWRKKLPK